MLFFFLFVRSTNSSCKLGCSMKSLENFVCSRVGLLHSLPHKFTNQMRVPLGTNGTRVHWMVWAHFHQTLHPLHNHCGIRDVCHSENLNGLCFSSRLPFSFRLIDQTPRMLTTFSSLNEVLPVFLPWCRQTQTVFLILVACCSKILYRVTQNFNWVLNAATQGKQWIHCHKLIP